MSNLLFVNVFADVGAGLFTHNILPATSNYRLMGGALNINFAIWFGAGQSFTMSMNWGAQPIFNIAIAGVAAGNDNRNLYFPFNFGSDGLTMAAQGAIVLNNTSSSAGQQLNYTLHLYGNILPTQ